MQHKHKVVLINVNFFQLTSLHHWRQARPALTAMQPLMIFYFSVLDCPLQDINHAHMLSFPSVTYSFRFGHTYPGLTLANCDLCLQRK